MKLSVSALLRGSYFGSIAGKIGRLLRSAGDVDSRKMRRMIDTQKGTRQPHSRRAFAAMLLRHR